MVYGGFLNFRPQYSRHGQRDIARTGTRKEFLFCEEEDDSHAIAEELSSRFFTHSPDAILSFVTGNQNFHSWKRDDYQSALQAGIVKLLSTFDLMVIDDGLNYGLTRLVSAAIRVHEEYRNYVGTAGVVKYGEPRNSPVYHLAFVVLSKMSPICRGRFQEFSSHTEGFEFDVDEQFRDLHDSGRQIDIDRLHSHYVLFQGRDYTRRILAEKQLQIELALRDLKTATESVFMPLVVFFIQGGLEELDRIALYIDLRVPVIIMDGCGGMADLVANALRTSLENCDESTIRRNLSASLLSAFPALHEDSEQLAKIR
ncbi:hypothetical protein BV898_05037 [Hypsibius exemplaris]|uniref:TRPM SLOG domain-containing protein n=1 Tax=Hypsibius exemplaris TaxID=2072580 RepID=A0A1W0X0Z3_HYPEX|nr:hypothetical protein BV898_05037 [Hypsibius exemplaris]